MSTAHMNPRTITGRWFVADGSSARFHVRDKLVATVHGTIPVSGGVATFDTDGVIGSARLELDLAGLVTGNPRRVADLREPGLLDIHRQPTLLLEVTAGTAGETGWTVVADVVVRGRRAPVELTATILESAADRLRVVVTGRFNRRPLGIRVPTFVIGRYLDLDAELRLTAQ